VQQTLPKDLKITPLFDQSGFVRAAISGVVREAVIVAALTAMLILLFLGNWRSTCIIAVSIPLSILTSIIALYIIGETLNIMTLGGLAITPPPWPRTGRRCSRRWKRSRTVSRA